MTLYTEEEVLRVLNMVSKLYKPLTVNQTIEHLTPIELPSDEEIKKMMEFDEFDSYDVSYLGGATWMRNKIQGGEQ